MSRKKCERSGRDMSQGTLQQEIDRPTRVGTLIVATI